MVRRSPVSDTSQKCLSSWSRPNRNKRPRVLEQGETEATEGYWSSILLSCRLLSLFRFGGLPPGTIRYTRKEQDHAYSRTRNSRRYRALSRSLCCKTAWAFSPDCRLVAFFHRSRDLPGRSQCRL